LDKKINTNLKVVIFSGSGFAPRLVQLSSISEPLVLEVEEGLGEMCAVCRNIYLQMCISSNTTRLISFHSVRKSMAVNLDSDFNEITPSKLLGNNIKVKEKFYVELVHSFHTSAQT
jgi:hypothetical protein